MKKLALILLTTVFLSQNSWAIVEVQKIDLRTAIQKALDTNPQMKIMGMDVEIAKNKIKSANRLENLSIEMYQNIGATRHGNPQQVGVSNVIEILKRGKRKDLAKSEEKVEINKKYFYQYNLILNVRKSYIDLLLKKSHLDSMKQQKEIAQDLYENMEKDSETGKIPKTEALQAKISLNRAIMAQNTAQAQVIISQNKFNSVMNTSEIDYDTKEDGLNINYEDLLTISPLNSTLLNFDMVKKISMTTRYDLRQAKDEVETAEKQLRVIKSKLIPDLNLAGGYGYETGAQSDNGHSMHGAYVGVSLVNIPIFYQYKPEIQNAKLEIEKAQVHYKDVETDAIRDIADAWEKFVTTREVLNFYNDKLLSNSKELMNEAIKALRKQEIDFVEFLVSKKTYFDIMQGYEEALADYYLSYAELLKEMNIVEVQKEEN